MLSVDAEAVGCEEEAALWVDAEVVVCENGGFSWLRFAQPPSAVRAAKTNAATICFLNMFFIEISTFH